MQQVILCIGILIGISWQSVFAQEKALQYKFEPPKFSKDGIGIVFTYSLPVVDGFASNINLQAQEYHGSIADYGVLSDGQFAGLGFKVISKQEVGNEIRYEYIGEMNENSFHWYARAIKIKQRVYLITATTKADRWEIDSPELVKSVDGFEVK